MNKTQNPIPDYSQEEHNIIISVEKMQWSELNDDEKKSIQREVLEATKDGKFEKVKALIQKYDGLRLEYVEYDDNHGDTPIHLAAFHGHLEILQYFIEQRDCHTECRNRYRNTPLHRAARQGHLHVVQYLVEEKECDPMCVCNWGRTPLHNACRHNKLEVAKYLISLEKVDVNAKDKRYGSQPLDLAAQYGSMEIVKYMLQEKKCYDESKYKGADTPLHFAAFGGKIDAVKYLIKHKIKYDIKGNRDRTPLHSACKGGKHDVVEYLMRVMKADPYCRDHEYGLTPLDLAAEHASLDVVKYMVEERGCNVKFPDENRQTMLHHAAYGGQLENVKFLIERNHIEADCKGWKGKTPLHSACRGGKYDVVEYLILECGVDPSLCRDNNGNTPLHSAAKNGDKSVVRLLIGFGCEPGIVNFKDKDPASVADAMGHKHISEYLAKAKKFQQSKFYVYLMNLV